MTITARFDGRCQICPTRIKAGERIEWVGSGQSRHLECPEKPVAAPQKAPVVQMDDDQFSAAEIASAKSRQERGTRAAVNGLYTVSFSEKDGDHQTFQIIDPDYGSFDPGTKLLKLAGSWLARIYEPDGTFTWGLVGWKAVAQIRDGKVYPFQKCQNLLNAPTADLDQQDASEQATLRRGIAAANVLLQSGDWWKYGKAYAMLSKRCWICDRPLTTPKSIESGIGPVCAKGVGKQLGIS